jgi:nidogen (entactin)
VVIASDGSDSYVAFLYADSGIQWIQGIGQLSGLPDARAQAGLVSGDGRLYTLRGSGTDQIQNLDKYGTFEYTTKQWLYKKNIQSFLWLLIACIFVVRWNNNLDENHTSS